MADERTYPCLPCRTLDDSIAFYESLGFRRTYRQIRPNPYAVVAREDLHIHLFGMDDFDPAKSYATAIVAVPDPDELYEAFAAGLRERYGKLPVAGIPRIGRPKKRYGTVRGFSVIDPGGNWLRISKLRDVEEDPKAPKARSLDQECPANRWISCGLKRDTLRDTFTPFSRAGHRTTSVRRPH